MKMTPLITDVQRSSVARTAALVVGLTVALIVAGCVSIAEGLAEAPYEKAMKQGRMLPSEFKKEQENIRRASEPGS